MPKKRKIETNLSRLIKGLGLTLAEFAREIGVSASAIKKTVEGKRGMSQELRSKIFSETGVIFVDSGPDELLFYTKEDHRKFKNETAFNEAAAKVAAGMVAKQVELLMLAASRPTVGKSLPIFNALNLALNKIKDEYHLEKIIDAVLRERHATQTRLYTIKELRENNLLADQVGFKDDPNYRDDQRIPLSKTTGWIPAKDCFNIAWQNRELFKELMESQEDELTKDQEERLQAMQAQMEREIDAFMPGFKSTDTSSVKITPTPPPAQN
jgi:transcriptional regulator with XRE-family HTH domain